MICQLVPIAQCLCTAPRYFYLSGVDQEETFTISRRSYEHQRDYSKERTHIAVWEGEKLTKERALAVSGIKTVYWLQFRKSCSKNDDLFRYNFINTKALSCKVETETREARFVKWWKDKYPACCRKE
jgi:Xaa-Pro aminopeptidase